MHFRLFTSRNRSILDLLKTSERRRISSSGCGDHGDDGFDVDNDIELPRDIVEDFCVSTSYIIMLHLFSFYLLIFSCSFVCQIFCV